MNNAPDWLTDNPTFVLDPNADYSDPLWTGLDILYDILPFAEFIQLFVDSFTPVPLWQRNRLKLESIKRL